MVTISIMLALQDLDFEGQRQRCRKRVETRTFRPKVYFFEVGRETKHALEKIFTVYRPISKKEFTDVIMKLNTPVHEYLLKKYQTIEDLFGITNPIRENDFIATCTAAEKKKQWESLRAIATLARKQYPDTVLGDYYLARYYEENGEPKKAMRSGQSAYDKEEVSFITVDLMLDRAEKIKEDFGY